MENTNKAHKKQSEIQTLAMSWNNVSPNDYHFFRVDEDSILNAYPLTNIK